VTRAACFAIDLTQSGLATSITSSYRSSLRRRCPLPKCQWQQERSRLVTLAARSGGWFASIDKGVDVRKEAVRILDDLHHRYVIGFVPATVAGLNHRLEVRVNRPGARVRVRDSYRPAR
jgi:hypothetical protein